MFDWLFEGYRSVYALLAAACLLLIVLWRRTGKRRWLAAAVAVASLAGLYCLLDFAVETDREQIQRKLQIMARGFKKPADLDAVFRNVSEQFRSPGGKSKQEIRALAQQYVAAGNVTDVKIKSFHCDEASRANKTAVVTFQAKVEGDFGRVEAVPFDCTATFEFDPVNGWLLKKLEPRGEGPQPDFFKDF